jgi:hypothetical protein
VKLIAKNLYFIVLSIFFVGCTNQQFTSTLLVGSQSASTDTTIPGGSEEDGQLDIRADNQDVSAMIEDTDRIEISGTCNDLNRKKNRIIVEAFSGENENDTPYVSNAISDFCQQTTVLSGNPSTGNGIRLGEECFWVTKGLGIVEDSTIPASRKSYPQCFNGRFSFAVRLGAAMQNPAPNGSRYLIRFKLRTLEGVIGESQWSRVYVTRKLSVPSIDSIEQNDNLYFCSLNMSPARFNRTIFYELNRTQVGSQVYGGTIPLFPANTSSTTITPGNSAYSYSDDITKGHGGMLAGVTYSYTLTAREGTPYFDGFVYNNPGPYIQTSETKSCTIANPLIEMTVNPTNVPIGSAPGASGPTCYLKLSGARLFNPGINSNQVTVRWAYSTVPGWTGPAKDFVPNAPLNTFPGSTLAGATVRQSACGGGAGCTASAAIGDVLGSGQTYYFAAQERDTATGGTGKWSNEMECQIPQSP